jgi:hypothetical protein
MSMPLKFQFQFAGVDFSRPSSPYRKWLRIGLMSLAALLAVMTYLFYLHHITHHARPVVHTVPAVPAVTVPKPSTPAPATAAMVATATATISTTSKLADAVKPHVIAVGNVLVEAVEHVATAAKATMAAPVLPVASVPVVEPVMVPIATPRTISSQPAAPRPLRVRTDQDRLLMAGQTALASVIELADKYPDAYGFQAGDFLSDAKLGAPMEVYTIDGNARAGYAKGQPVKPLLKPAAQWVFPVLMGNRICCMVDVERTGHDFVPGKGSKSLAMAWSKIQQQWPAAAGFHPLLVVNPEVPGYYFTVPELPEQNLTDTVEMFYLHPDPSPADVILASWR